MRTLIADDDFFTRLTLKTTLEAYGSCDMVTNGEEAVQIFADAFGNGQPYHLVLLDILMPEMDGMEAVKRIRQFEKEAHVAPKKEAVIFMVTALDTAATVVDAFMEGGCTDYIVKSDSLHLLIHKIKECGLI